MSGRKIKTIRKHIGDKSVVDMFNQMLGAEGADPSIIFPKYNTIKSRCAMLHKTLSAMVTDVLSKSFPEQSKGCDEIMKFVKEIKEIKFMEFPEIADRINGKNNDNLDKKHIEPLTNQYNSIKKNNTIRMVIMTCKSLIGYKNNLSTENSFDDSFIARIPGFILAPFPFSCLNLKEVWVSPNITMKIKKYIFTVLKLVLDISHKIYETLTSPDVNVKDFSEAIISSIGKIKKQIPRCDKAFKKIEESVGLLENNFNGYYKDFVQSRNPSTIIESFVIDVSQSGTTDPQTTRQFRTIISHYQKLTQGKIKDPRVKKIFDTLNHNFDIMEKSESKGAHMKK
jgi:hypothetical protein